MPKKQYASHEAFKRSTLWRTDLLVCAIIVLGFIATSYISYRSNFGIFSRDIERVSSLASDGIYFQINSISSQPVSVSLTMSNDSLLKRLLTEEKQRLGDDTFTMELQDYLAAYKDKYGYDSVFLVSAATNRYYHYNGLDRVLELGDPENDWYYAFLNGTEEYSINIDNDEASSDIITTFINCRIKADDGSTMGIVGVGVKVDYLQAMLQEYNEQYGVQAYLVDDLGYVQVSSTATRYMSDSNLFDGPTLFQYKEAVLGTHDEKQTFWYSDYHEDGYLVSQFLPNLMWHLVVINDTSAMDQHLATQFRIAMLIIVLIVLLVLITITSAIRKYNTQLVKLTVSQELEYQHLLQSATAGLYEYIFEWDITHNRPIGENTIGYLKSLGMQGSLTYDEAIRAIAEHEIKQEHIQGYMDTYATPHVLEAFEKGVTNISYDFLKQTEENCYRWIRLRAQLFFWSSDQSVRMITYRQDIDTEKSRELSLIEQTKQDSLSGLLNKRSAEEAIASILRDSENGFIHALLVMDIDDFKNVNDRYGHAFGDVVLQEFSAELKSHFRESDIVGRIGGDEFVVLMRSYGAQKVILDKLGRLCDRLGSKQLAEHPDYSIAVSIGVALYPEDGTSYGELYEKADQALYFSKRHGKNAFTLFHEDADDSMAYLVNQRDMERLINTSVDGVSKVACKDGVFKLLYFNAARAALTGTPVAELAEPKFDVLGQIHAEDLPGALEIFYQAIANKSTFSVNIRLRHHDGHYFPVRLRGLFVNELYENQYPIFYATYTDLSQIPDAPPNETAL